jgi:hypothetical protein
MDVRFHPHGCPPQRLRWVSILVRDKLAGNRKLRGNGAVAVWMLFWRTRVMLAMLAVDRGKA